MDRLPKKGIPEITRKNFLRWSALFFLALASSPVLSGCTETEKPPALLPPLIVRLPEGPMFWDNLTDRQRTYFNQLFAQAPSLLAQPPVEGLILPPNIPPLQGPVTPTITVFPSGLIKMDLSHNPYPKGGPILAIGPNGQNYLYPVGNLQLPIDHYQSLLTFRGPGPIPGVIQSVASQPAPPPDMQTAHMEKYWSSHLTGLEMTTLFSPGCRRYLEQLNNNMPPEGQYTMSALHYPDIAWDILKTLLVFSERGPYILGYDNNLNPQKKPVILPRQPPEAVAVVGNKSFRQPDGVAGDGLGEQLNQLEALFRENCYPLQAEPMALAISRIDGNHTSTEVFLLGDDNRPVKIGSLQEEEIPAPIRWIEIDQLSDQTLKVLDLDRRPVGTKIIQLPTRFFWTGKDYRYGVDLPNGSVLVQKDGLRKKIGEATESLSTDTVVDLSDWRQKIANKGIDRVGPAGLTIPDLIIRAVHGGFDPYDPNTAAFFKEQPIDSLFSSTTLAEKAQKTNFLGIVIEGELPLYTQHGPSNIFPLIEENRPAGRLSKGDVFPLPGPSASIKTTTTVKGETDKYLVLGSHRKQTTAIPYRPGQIAYLTGGALRALRQLDQLLAKIKTSLPQINNFDPNLYFGRPPEEREKIRKIITEQLLAMPQF